jgi:SAM-dependent methyltransferase
MEISFWNNHYKNFTTIGPSTFAQYCSSEIIRESDTVIEVGCGNGRDGILLAQNCMKYTGIDQSDNAIESFKSHILNSDLFDKDLQLLNLDINNIELSSIMPKHSGRVVFYLRFSLHSLDEAFENRLLDFLSKYPHPAIILVEARTIFDPLFGVGHKQSDTEFISDHYRRFLKPDVFLSKVIRLLKVEFFELSKGRAVFNSEDPLVLRCHLSNKI